MLSRYRVSVLKELAQCPAFSEQPFSFTVCLHVCECIYVYNWGGLELTVGVVFSDITLYLILRLGLLIECRGFTVLASLIDGWATASTYLICRFWGMGQVLYLIFSASRFIFKIQIISFFRYRISRISGWP